MDTVAAQGIQLHDPGRLIDGELELVLAKACPGDPVKAKVPAYRFRMMLASHEQEIGHIELRVGNTDHIRRHAGHLGYRVEPQHQGRRFAARACRLLLPLARKHQLETLWITCDPDNIASRRTCELAGARFVETVELPENTDMYQRGDRLKCRYRLDL
jgi:tagatose 1,6-diphosphate aldolase